MKKLLAIVMIMTFASQGNAQYVVDNEPWCPTGATWIYRFFSTTSREYMKYEYVKDTIVEQQSVKKLDVYNIRYIGPGLPPDNGARIVGFIGHEYIYESNDSIFWYDTSTTNFEYLYRFNAQVGDEQVLRTAKNHCDGRVISDTITVLSLTTDTFDNRIFNAAVMSYGDSVRLGTILSRIGPNVSFLPEANPTYCPSFNFFEELVCYMDNIRGIIQFSNQGVYGDCQNISTSINDKKHTSVKVYTVYPNPAKNTIKIDEVKQLPMLLQIYNFAGRLVMEQLEFKGEVSVLELSAGVYIVKLTDTKGENGYAKFIKQ
jgi:hypothetical protein